MTDRDLPAIELLDAGAPELDEPPRRGWRLGSWREAPVASALAAGVLLITLMVAGMQLADRWHEPPDPLHEWAAGQHELDPPAGITVPTPTCEEDARDVLAVRRCLRDGHAAGRRVAGHLQYELGFPDAVDQWFELAPDGSGTMTERWLSPEPRPDVEEAGEVRRSDLRQIRTTWRSWDCDAVVFTAEPDVYPGLECLPGVDEVPEPVRAETWFRPIEPEDRERLVRAFACAYPDELQDVEC